ncbi:MAG: indolepyruvate ferredoxin oxidoreductase subunit alpha [Candidatus Bathyarchaeota archaeon]|nr:indolepyruvate ferredoxin oxidoreductase subunit alpha [Candidatus Bathyarchaeota archaeon]
MSHPVALDKPGERVVLMGNEAIARGAIEGGITIATAYPGTPSSEIGNTFGRVSKDTGVYFEWSANEKVALEVAYGASMVGQRSICSMKHVGVNVALDILNPITLRGVKGGLVLVSTDDPSQHSSRTEQDNRWLGRHNDVPILEPSSPQEAKDLTKYALELSEKSKLPVMIRTVTRLSHMRSDVELGEIQKLNRKPEFDWEGFSYRVAGFEKLFRRHKERHGKIDFVQEEFEEMPFNELKLKGDEKIGIIGAGFAYTYVKDSLVYFGVEDKVAWLKLASVHPIPERLVTKLIESVDTVFIAEEVDPFVELHVKALAKDVNPDLVILGRMSGYLPREGELSPELIDGKIAELLGIEKPTETRVDLENAKDEMLFDRMLTMCAGCPHRSSIYALKKAVKEVKGDLMNVVVNGDIGCYGLAHAPPMEFEDTYFAMGASIGVSQGMQRFGVDTIAWIGDGTFFHAGIPALQNAVHNGNNVKIVVADNAAIAMTGFQTNPQMGITATGTRVDPIMIEDIAKASGVKHVEVVDPYNLEAAEAAFKRMLEVDGVAMVIARRECAMVAVRQMRPDRPPVYYVDQDACIGCKLCLNTYGCPALMWNEYERKASIDTTLCMGCTSCVQVCPSDAIHRRNDQ